MRWGVLLLVVSCLLGTGCGGDTTTIIRQVPPRAAAPPRQGTALELRQAALAEGTACGAYGADACRLAVEISTTDPDWGAVHIEPRPGHEAVVQRDSASLLYHRGEWRLIQAGNGGGCDVPRGIADELGLGCF